METIRKGKLIILEGVDSSGKGTYAKILKKRLGNNKSFHFTREPGGDSLISERIRELILSNDLDMTLETEMYLFASSRAEQVKNIEKKLNEGVNVICERYVHSSMAYQSIGTGLSFDDVFGLNKIALRGVVPDLVVYFDVSMDILESRMKKRDKDRIECREKDYFKQVINNYKEIRRLGKYERESLVVTSTNEPISEEKILSVLQKINDVV